MGLNLWKSAATGRRRRGTTLHELRQSVGFGARAIYEVLQSCEAHEPAQNARAELDRLGFDVAGVVVAPDSPVYGYIVADDLGAGTVGERCRRLDPSDLVAESTPIGKVMHVLQAKGRAFVLVDSDVAGIVTKADLNKPPARVYLFGIVSLLELHMTHWIRKHYQEHEWTAKLGKKGLAAAKELHAKRIEDKVETTLLECVQFADKSELVCESERLRAELDLGSKSLGKRMLRRTRKFRDNLAHSQPDISVGLGWDQIFELTTWVEGLLDRSDAALQPTEIPGANVGG